MNTKQIVFTGINTAELLDKEIPAVGAHSVDKLIYLAYIHHFGQSALSFYHSDTGKGIFAENPSSHQIAEK